MDDQHVQAYYDLTPMLRAIVDKAFESLQTRYSPAVAEHVIAQAVARAYNEGRHTAISELMTTDDAALQLGKSRRMVQLRSQQHEIGWEIGRDRLYRPEDVDQLRAIFATDGRRSPKPVED